MGVYQIGEEEVERLNRAIIQMFEYDFSNYAMSSYVRRIERILQMHNFKDINDLIVKLRTEPAFFEEYLREVTVNTTEMFRDPAFWSSLRKHVIPSIAEHNVIRIWLAGCSSGEEVYSMAILLKECGLYDKTRIFATDINDRVLETARAGCYSMKNMDTHRKNYIESGGPGALDDYCTLTDTHAVMHPELLKNVMLRKHNLVNGEEFSKFDLILCRNVIIYFNRNLQDKVFQLFESSMFAEAWLGIGSRESLIWSSNAEHFDGVDISNNIYRLK